MDEFIALSNILTTSKLEIGEIRHSNHITDYYGRNYRLDSIEKFYVLATALLAGGNVNYQGKSISDIQIPIEKWRQLDLVSPEMKPGMIKQSQGTTPKASRLLKGLISRLDTHSPNRSED